MAKVTIKQRGGDKLNRLFREAMKGSVKNVKVGFFSTAKYPDRTPVAAVAAWNEFGTNSIPERPFFRSALEEAKPKVIQTLKTAIDPKKMTVGPQLAGRIGAQVAGEVQKSITRWRTSRMPQGPLPRRAAATRSWIPVTCAPR